MSRRRNPIPILTPEQLAARNALVVANMRLVRAEAKKLHATLPPWISLEDLVSAGTFGLIDAVHRYDPARGATLETFARLKIRGAIITDLWGLDWAGKVYGRRVKRMARVREELTPRLRREPSDAEIAGFLGVGLAEGRLTRRDGDPRPRVGSLAANKGTTKPHDSGDRMSDGGGSPTGNLIPDPQAPDPSEQATRDDLIRHLFRWLTEVESWVLRMYYLGEWTLTEIGEMLCVTESRCCQIKNEALKRLRKKLAGPSRRDRKLRPAP